MYKAAQEHLGYKETAVTSSEKALELFRTAPESFNLVITDQTMPTCSGAELAREILLIKNEMPIILCTGCGTMISQEKAKELHITRFAQKPLT